jgi:hypothetical protein
MSSGSIFPDSPSCLHYRNSRENLGALRRNNREYQPQNPDRKNVEVYVVDGCLVTGAEEKKCDFLLANCSNSVVYFIELKGRDLEDAIEQVRQTIRRYSSTFADWTIHARIILTRCNPVQYRSAAEVALDRWLSQNYNGRLRTATRAMSEPI